MDYDPSEILDVAFNGGTMSDEAERAGARASQGQAQKAMTIAEIRKKKRPNTAHINIQIDGELAAEIDRLKAEHSAAVARDKRFNEPETAPAIARQIEDLIEESRDTEVTFTFQSIGRVAYDELVSDPEHQASEEQRKEGAQFNPNTFPPALVAASCTDPEITLEDAIDIFSDPSWNGAELQRLFFGALSVNTDVADIPLFKSGTAGTPNSVLNLISAANEGSPTPSS